MYLARNRSIPSHTYPIGELRKLRTKDSDGSVVSDTKVQRMGLMQTQQCVDVSHPGYQKYLGKWNVGSSFLVVRGYSDFSEVEELVGKIKLDSSTTTKVWSPDLPSTYGSLPWPAPPVDMGASNLRALGATAISRCLPTNPLWDAGTFVGELRQLPRFPGRALKRHGLKGTGDEYLNLEFGINPILRDSKSAKDAARNADVYLKQLERNSRRFVRRSYDFPNEYQSNFVDLGVITHTSSPGSPFPARRLTRIETSETQVWFRGAFTYFYARHQPGSFSATLQKLTDVYGLEITPEVGWNLLPFSWLVDWETNVGDVFHNITRFAQDGLVMKYGYIMRKQINTYRYNYGSSSFTYNYVVKRREMASPFGFGITPSSFSGTQWAILAALGQQKVWR